MERYPVAYIRRSSADADNPGDVSREAQEAAVRDLAHRDGHNGNLRVFDDWNRSADESKEARRTAFAAMLAEIEAGKVEAVYAYALDRLYRSMRTFVRLTDAAKAHDVRVVTQREGVLGGDGSPMAQAFAQITAVFSELELNTAKARARGALEARRQRGDALGQAPYGYKHAKVDGRLVRVPDPAQPVEPVLAAYRRAGSVLGACRLLEEAEIPAPRGGKRWATSLVTRIIEEHAPDVLPRRQSLTGRRQPVHGAMLAQLLRCPHCDAILTPNVARGQYYCRHGARDRASHPRYTLTEREILPWIMAEAERFEPPFDQAEMSSEAEARRETLAAKRARWIEQYGEGLIDKAERDRRLSAIDRELGDVALRADTLAVIPEAIDWDNPPEKLNAFLRSIWHYVELDGTMRPTRAEWIIPEWRS